MTIVLIFAVPISFIKKQLPGGVFYKKGVLRNFTNFTGKHRCQSLFFNKVAGLRPANLLKKRLEHSYFLENFVKFLRTPFHIEHLWWLLLHLELFLKIQSRNLQRKGQGKPKHRNKIYKQIQPCRNKKAKIEPTWPI